jgi:hypothetical protein
VDEINVFYSIKQKENTFLLQNLLSCNINVRPLRLKQNVSHTFSRPLRSTVAESASMEYVALLIAVMAAAAF